MKLLTIGSCSSCYNINSNGFHNRCCKNLKLVSVIDSIPDWCPLPDAPQEIIVDKNTSTNKQSAPCSHNYREVETCTLQCSLCGDVRRY